MAATKRKTTKALKKGNHFSRREFTLYMAIFAAVGAFTLWVSFAAPKANTPGSISIATVNGAPYSPSVSLKIGQTLTFNTISGSLAGWEYPLIALACFQDVNGDGKIDTTVTAQDIVYTQLQKPGTELSFAGQGGSSIWTLRGGGPAICRADLDAYGWKGGKESVRVMATTGDLQVLGQ